MSAQQRRNGFRRALEGNVIQRHTRLPGNLLHRQVLRGRGPFRIEDDLDLLRSHDIDVLVTKDSGGPTDAKLDAASELGVPVVMIRRPAPPEGVPVVTDVADVVVWLRGVRRGAAGQRRRSR